MGKNNATIDGGGLPSPARTRLPAHLEDVAERLRGFIQGAKAENTIRAYVSDWAHFEDWCRESALESMPATASTVALYLAAHSDCLKPSTLRRRLSSISKIHQFSGHTTPTRDPLVRTAWDGIRRAKGTRQSGKKPLLTDGIREMVDTLPDTLTGLRDRAIILTGFAGCMRRSEVVGLNVEDLSFVKEGMVVLISKSKTDQAGEGLRKGLPYGSGETCPVRAMKWWLEAAAIYSGPVFRSIDRHGNISDRRLSDKSVANIVKSACLAAGLDPALYAGHSLRSGLATQAAISGVSESAIIKQGAWASEKMARRYVRDGNLFRDNAAGQVGL